MNQPNSFGTPSGPELTAAVVDKITQRRALDAEILDLLATMDTEHVASDAGYASLAAYVCEATHMSRGAARQLVARAAHLAETITPTGHVTPAVLPHTRDVMHEGVLDGDHLDAIVETVKQLPSSAPVALRELFDQTLADTALVVRDQGCSSAGATIRCCIRRSGPYSCRTASRTSGRRSE